jgi:RNA recognition motif-containing protein
MTSIFVAKLDFGVTSEDLKKAFQTYGTVLKATVAMDRETGKSRGFGFVEMADRDEALSAIKGLDGSTMNGRQIAVKEAEQRQDNRGPRDNNRPPREGNRPFQPRTDQPFKPRENNPPKPNSDDDDEPTAFVPRIAIDPLKPEPRKKLIGKDKEKKKPIEEDRSKKPKLSPYKKSGKMNRFMDDDDDDFDPESASLFDFGDEEDDWDNENQNDHEDWEEEDDED